MVRHFMLLLYVGERQLSFSLPPILFRIGISPFVCVYMSDQDFKNMKLNENTKGDFSLALSLYLSLTHTHIFPVVMKPTSILLQSSHKITQFKTGEEGREICIPRVTFKPLLQAAHFWICFFLLPQDTFYNFP